MMRPLDKTAQYELDYRRAHRPGVKRFSRLKQQDRVRYNLRQIDRRLKGC